MVNKQMKADQVRLARVRYYDDSKKGIEVDNIGAYAFLVKAGTKYINIFDITSDLPVFERVPYSNTTKDGEDFGSKVMQISGVEDVSGLVYVLEDSTAKDLFNEDQVSDELLKRYIIHSKKFFVDRKSIIQDCPSKLEMLRALPILLSDEKKHAKLQRLVDSHITENVK